MLRLFERPDVRDRGVSPKWLPVRAAFTAATVGAPARRRADRTAAHSTRSSQISRQYW